MTQPFTGVHARGYRRVASIDSNARRNDLRLDQTGILHFSDESLNCISVSSTSSKSAGMAKRVDRRRDRRRSSSRRRKPSPTKQVADIAESIGVLRSEGNYEWLSDDEISQLSEQRRAETRQREESQQRAEGRRRRSEGLFVVSGVVSIAVIAWLANEPNWLYQPRSQPEAKSEAVAAAPPKRKPPARVRAPVPDPVARSAPAMAEGTERSAPPSGPASDLVTERTARAVSTVTKVPAPDRATRSAPAVVADAGRASPPPDPVPSPRTEHTDPGSSAVSKAPARPPSLTTNAPGRVVIKAPSLALTDTISTPPTSTRPAHRTVAAIRSEPDSAANNVALPSAPRDPVADDLSPDQTARGVSPVGRGDLGTEIVDTLNAWAAAWSSQRIEDYLAFYSNRFRSPQGEGIEVWRQQRTSRLARPAYIRVDVSTPKIEVLAEHRVRVTFEQSYRSDIYVDWAMKTLELVREGGSWKIIAEQAASS